MPHIDLETLLKQYTEGRISKKEFVHLHSLITQSKQPIQRPQKPPTLRQKRIAPQQVHTRAPDPNEFHTAQSGVFHFFKSRYKSVMAFLGSLWIFATLAVNYFNGLSLPFLKDSGQPAAIVQQEPISKPPQPRPLVRKDVKLLAQSLVREPIWEAHSVNEFTTQWIMLSAQQKDKVKKSPWFNKFADAFTKQIKFELARRKDEGNTAEIENRHRALMQLAISLGMVRNAPSTLADLDKSLSSVDKPPKAKVKSTKPEKKSVVEKKPVVKTDTAAKKVSKAPAPKRRDISGRDIIDVIDQYTAAFEKGSSQQMLALFADDKLLQQPLTLQTVRNQYADLFKHSEERWVEFRGLTWEKQGLESRGKGKMRTSMRLLPTGDYKTVTTDVMIAMRKIDNVTRITDFAMEDDSIFALARSLKQNRAVKNLGTKDRPKYPTQGELQDLITQYVDSYQTGDIRRIMELFASGTWTADPAGLEELRKEYVSLFQNTTDRQLFISNVQWSFKGNKAMGTGDLVVNLLSKQDHNITKKKGKVRLIVEKNLQKTRISHLFQIVN